MSYLVTAGDLRSIGMPVPDKIPNEAWIRAAEIKASMTNVSYDFVAAEDINDGSGLKKVLVTELFYEFAGPFRWSERTERHIENDTVEPRRG